MADGQGGDAQSNDNSGVTLTLTGTHKESFTQVCQDGDLDIARAMVERTQVDLEARDALYGRTPLLWVARNGHLPVVQYLCEQGADKEARSDDGRTPLTLADMGAKEDFNDAIESEEEWEERMGSLRCVVEYLKQRPT